MNDLTKNKLFYVEDAITSILQEADKLENNGDHILYKRLGIPWCRPLHIGMGDDQFCSWQKGEKMSNVIKCEKCQHRRECGSYDTCQHEGDKYYCTVFSTYVNSNDFCSYAERREDE